jgi:hypothetical protein
MKSKEKDLVIQLSGGIGKAIMATSFVKWLNEQYPKRKITVVSPWPEIFEYNPRVWRNLPVQQAYLYEDYIKGRDFRMGEPYQRVEYYREDDKKHLCNVYPLAYGFDKTNDEPQNEIYFNQGEMYDVQQFINQGPPVFTIQMSGGIPQGVGGVNIADKIDSSQRDFTSHMGQHIVDNLNSKGFRVLQICQANEPKLKNVIHMNTSFRKLAALTSAIAGHIGIDSSYMHACSVTKTPMMIFWGQTHKNNVGYSYDGSIHKSKPESMHCRPKVQMPDRAGVFPYRDANEHLAMNWSPDELTTSVNEFVKWVEENRFPKIYPHMKKPLIKEEKEKKEEPKD